jgi:hypothetical protein
MPQWLQRFGAPVALFAEYQHTWWQTSQLNRPAASPSFNYNFAREDETLKLGMTIWVGSDVRLKRDIALLEWLDRGIGLYRYRYLWDDTVYVGVMAQEVARVLPDAVRRGGDGYLRVDYARLGLRLTTWDAWRASAPMEHAE